MEGRVIGEAALLRGAGGVHALPDQVRRVHQPPLADIGVNAHSRLRLKQAHEMIAADMKAVGQIVHAEVFRQVFADIGENGGCFFVVGALSGTDGLRVDRQTAEQDQQLDDIAVAHRLRTEVRGAEALLDPVEHRGQLGALLPVGREEVLRTFVRAVKAAEQPGLRHQAVEKLAVKIQNDALVRTDLSTSALWIV